MRQIEDLLGRIEAAQRMALRTHGDAKYLSGERLGGVAEWDALRLERRQLMAGAQSGVTAECTELVLILSGQSSVRRIGDGQYQEGLARPGTSWLVPAGTHESELELTGSIETLHLFLPAELLDQSALADYDIDPARTRLAYAGGQADATVEHIGTALRGVLDRGAQPTDRIFVDGMRTALAAHLVGNYAADFWQPPARTLALDATRLRRVLDFIEARLSGDISLDDLAAEACLSPFHFSRLFRDATGLSPHRYVTDRRIQAAREKLVLDHSSQVEIALDCGFGSQANFIRVFRKATGLTPGQYRNLQAR